DRGDLLLADRLVGERVCRARGAKQQVLGVLVQFENVVQLSHGIQLLCSCRDRVGASPAATRLNPKLFQSLVIEFGTVSWLTFPGSAQHSGAATGQRT